LSSLLPVRREFPKGYYYSSPTKKRCIYIPHFTYVAAPSLCYSNNPADKERVISLLLQKSYLLNQAFFMFLIAGSMVKSSDSSIFSKINGCIVTHYLLIVKYFLRSKRIAKFFDLAYNIAVKEGIFMANTS